MAIPREPIEIGGGDGGPTGTYPPATPTPSPTPTPTPTPSPTPTPTPSPTPTGVPAVLAVLPVLPTVTTIPLAAVPSQTLAVALGTQACLIVVYQKSSGLYMDLTVAGRPIITGTLCRDRTALVRDAYHGFAGDLTFADLQGVSDPTYDALGTRYQLVWLAP